MDLKGFKDSKEFKEKWVHKVRKEKPDPREFQVNKALKACKGNQALKGLEENSDLKGLKESLVHKEYKEKKVT